MKWFGKKKEEVVDPRTPIEKAFEDKAQAIGRKTGKVVQQGVNKIEAAKAKLEEDGTLDKLRQIGDKVDQTIDQAVDKVAKKGKEIASRRKNKELDYNDEDTK
jgi:hypothetical protein